MVSIFTHLKASLWRWSTLGLTPPSVTGVVLLIKLSGWLQPIEWWALDQLFCFRPPEPPDSRITVVEIRETDIRRLGHPLEDSVLATLIAKIRDQNPLAIGLDLYRDFPVPKDESQYAQITQIFETTPNLIGISKVIGDAKDPAVLPPPALEGKGQVAANDVVVDFDGKLRRGLLYLPDSNDNNVLGLGFQLSLMYLSQQGYQLTVTPDDQLQIGSVVFPVFTGNEGGYVNTESGGYQVLLNYRGSTDKFNQVSVDEVLNDRIPETEFENRIVLIGSVAESLKDFFYSPYSSDFRYAAQTPPQIPGVYYHANLTSQIISSVLDGRSLIQAWPTSWEIGWIFLWTSLGTGLTWWLRPGSPWQQRRSWQQLGIFGKRRILLPVMTLGLIAGAYSGFRQGMWIPLVPALLGLSGGVVAVTMHLAHSAEKIRKTFGRYVTDDVVHSLLETPDGMKLGGERRTVSILMSDIRGFSAISERFPPETVVAFLNIYLEIMADVITNYQGTIDEFIGDAILVIFGAPIARTDHAERAVACALAMQIAMDQVNERIQSLGVPELSMGIAINTGDVVVGNIGSIKRAKYGVVGSQVNLTGRIESFTDAGQVLIAESTFQAVESIVKVDQVLPIQPKGFQGTLNIYDVVGIDAKYSLRLPKKDRRLTLLSQPLPLQFFELENKHVVGNLITSHLTHLSDKHGRIKTDSSIKLLRDLKINLHPASEIPPFSSDVYGKVIEVHPGKAYEPHEYLVSFTEIPPDAQVLFTQLLETDSVSATTHW